MSVGRFFVIVALSGLVGTSAVAAPHGPDPLGTADAALHHPHRLGSAGAIRTDSLYHDAMEPCGSTPGAEVITREDIRNAGLVRLSELFRLSEKWYAYSIDGYRWDAQASGLSPASNPRWSLVIDGKPVDLGLMGIQSLDVAPIHMNEIACIELVSRPAVVAGAVRPFGTIHVTTYRPRLGLTFNAGVSAGNEINDPGPFLYTPQATANVDRIGPVGTGRIELRSDRRFARLSGKLDEFHATDLQMDLRAKELYDADSKPRLNVQAVALTAGMDANWGTHSLLGGYSDTDDLIFLTALGLEVPSTRRFDYLGGGGTFRLGPAEMRYRGGYLSHDLVKRQNAADLEFDFRKRLYSGALESRIRSGPVGVSAGWSIDVTDVRSTQALSETKTLVTQVFGETTGSVGGLVEATLHAAWIQADERPAFALYHHLHVTPDPNHRIDLTASLSRRTTSMDETLWRWTRVGYGLPDLPLEDEEPASGSIEAFTSQPEPRLVTIDLEYAGRVADVFRYSIAGYYRRSLSEYLPVYDLAYNRRSSGLTAKTRIQSFVSGHYAGISASVGLRLFRRLTQRVTYVAEGATAGDRAFEDVHARVPAQRIAYTVTYSPVDRFSLFARVRYHVGTVWQEYQSVAASSNGFYPAELPDALLVDFAATKRFWKDHVVANVSVRNVMNEPHRMHPIGAIFDMAFHFAVRVSFNSEAGF